MLGRMPILLTLEALGEVTGAVEQLALPKLRAIGILL
jgi:hypothetical protein